jgi:hypothetical protein
VPFQGRRKEDQPSLNPVRLVFIDETQQHQQQHLRGQTGRALGGARWIAAQISGRQEPVRNCDGWAAEGGTSGSHALL